jgi:hypothetical protein
MAAKAAGQSAGPYPAARSQWCSSTSTSRRVSSPAAGNGAESSTRTRTCQAWTGSCLAIVRSAIDESARSVIRSLALIAAPCPMSASRACALA